LDSDVALSQPSCGDIGPLVATSFHFSYEELSAGDPLSVYRLPFTRPLSVSFSFERNEEEHAALCRDALKGMEEFDSVCPFFSKNVVTCSPFDSDFVALTIARDAAIAISCGCSGQRDVLALCLNSVGTRGILTPSSLGAALLNDTFSTQVTLALYQVPRIWSFHMTQLICLRRQTCGCDRVLVGRSCSVELTRICSLH
jgi:hypothetical protein